ncbi:hypothetical protein [Paenibacillus sp.]|uniref:hypothetical protein n=1 Tax=Paenibacillus sp. TaxID=58172 RepID=UPI002D4779E2|nr:hypothetical protein [Paenibacillus sp.]HZG85605.1 hypothetical protein [Paenibacillus sp.]
MQPMDELYREGRSRFRRQAHAAAEGVVGRQRYLGRAGRRVALALWMAGVEALLAAHALVYLLAKRALAV